jgi:hypothetical protein
MPYRRLAAVHVLVVDDNVIVRELVTTLLEDHGATVTSVGSAAQALRVLAPERPDVLLTDLSMPEADWIQLDLAGPSPSTGTGDERQPPWLRASPLPRSRGSAARWIPILPRQTGERSRAVAAGGDPGNERMIGAATHGAGSNGLHGHECGLSPHRQMPIRG